MQFDELSREHEDKAQALDAANQKLHRAQSEVIRYQKECEELKEEYQQITNQNLSQPGRIWERQPVVEVPPFVESARRRVAIISLINLKGGVGKTTLSANLAAMLAMHGKRVLLVDCDYQRSLSRLCFEDARIRDLFASDRTLQHFLLDKRPDAARLLKCAAEHPDIDGGIVINAEALDVRGPADSLEDAEMHLQSEWLVRPRSADVRFLLRAALHSPALEDHFDYVLLDCPPRLSTACINALAASDFALVPVMLDPVSAISAPNLLRKLRQLRDKNILPGLAVLGVVANRVQLRDGAPIKDQHSEWKELPKRCEVAWQAPVHFFESKIKQSAEFGKAAHRHRFAAFSAELKPAFTDLMHELEKRVAHESKRVTGVPA